MQKLYLKNSIVTINNLKLECILYVIFIQFMSLKTSENAHVSQENLNFLRGACPRTPLPIYIFVKTRQGKARQGKARQGKARHDMTRQEQEQETFNDELAQDCKDKEIIKGANEEGNEERQVGQINQ